jgi:hypothetical protein
MRLHPILAAACLLALAAGLAAQGAPSVPNPQLLETIKLNALVFSVKASIIGTEGVAWAADQNRVTVHGIPVTIKLEGTDMLIMAELTPYRQTPDSILLAIKNELWLRDPGAGTVQYFISIKSALVKLNSPVYFYPLGKGSGDGRPVIKMDITVNPYQEAKE